MHELSLMEHTLDLAADAARRQGARRILEIRLKVGALSGVVPEALAFAFEALAPGTPAEGARLRIDHEPLACYCSACNLEFAPAGDCLECPQCRSPRAEIRRGRELELAALEVE